MAIFSHGTVPRTVTTAGGSLEWISNAAARPDPFYSSTGAADPANDNFSGTPPERVRCPGPVRDHLRNVCRVFGPNPPARVGMRPPVK